MTPKQARALHEKVLAEETEKRRLEEVDRLQRENRKLRQELAQIARKLSEMGIELR